MDLLKKNVEALLKELLDGKSDEWVEGQHEPILKEDNQ